MSKKVFDYGGMTRIGIKCNQVLLERISENLESEISIASDTNCLIRINEVHPPIQIVKDKRFPYLTVNEYVNLGVKSINYKRYDTDVRTIHREGFNNYSVSTNISLDEEAALISIRNHIINHQGFTNRNFLHSSLVEIDSEGILIAGERRQGKSTLAIYLLQEMGATFVSDENVILSLSENRINGLYFPRTPSVRFSTISRSKLDRVLENISLTRATQYIDSDAIGRIIESKNYHVDAGLSFSRKALCELLGTTSKDSAVIGRVIFPIYNPSEDVVVHKLTIEEGLKRLSQNGLVKRKHIKGKEFRNASIDLDKGDYTQTKFYELEFAGIDSLLRRGLRLWAKYQ